MNRREFMKSALALTALGAVSRLGAAGGPIPSGLAAAESNDNPDRIRIFTVNGGPRRKWNTDLLCDSFADGAASAGAEVERVHLYDLDFKGCHSCFLCKKKNGRFYGRCGYPDDIFELLEQVSLADGVALATPVYFSDATGVFRGFLERLLFPYRAYTEPPENLAPKKLQTCMLYTMGTNEEQFRNILIGPEGNGPLGQLESRVESVWTKPERVCAFDTYQFDYDAHVASRFDPGAKAERRNIQFPQDRESARLAGIRMVEKIKAARAT